MRAPGSPLSLIETWPVPNVAAAIVGTDGSVQAHGDTTRRFRLASISKIITTWATLVAVEEGSLSLDTPIGQDDCTLRHLLSHAGGWGDALSAMQLYGSTADGIGQPGPETAQK